MAAGARTTSAPAASAQATRAHPVTIVSPCPRWWAWWLRLSWRAAPAVQAFGRLLRMRGPGSRLPLIHFAHWAVWRRPRNHYVVFQSNFNGDIAAYIDAFAIVVPGRMRLLWGGAYGFPGTAPAGPFKEFILARALTADHYFHAYPHASVRMVLGALAVSAELERFTNGLDAELSDEQFAARWHESLSRMQAHL